MSIYKIQPLVESGFDFSTIFPEKQKTLQEFGGFNFGIQDIVNLLATQTDNFTKKNEVALDVDKYIYEAYEKQRALNEPEATKEQTAQPKEEKKKSVEDYEKIIKGYNIKLKTAKSKEDKDWISKKIKGYEIKLKSMKAKKEKGGEVAIETQHSFGDPKENTDTKIDLLFSAQDPKKEDGGVLESVKLRNIQSGKVSDWDLSEVIDSINKSGEGSGVIYDEKNWLDGFDNISENYSLLDESGNALNDFSNYAKGGAFEKLAKHVAKEYEGHKVAPEYQKEYGKKYSREEAVEVGKKVAAKVYREQLANK